MEDPVGREVVSELMTVVVLYSLLGTELVAEVRDVDSAGGGAVG